jgi:hypothetical protein
MPLDIIASEIVAWVLGRCWYTNIYGGIIIYLLVEMLFEV